MSLESAEDAERPTRLSGLPEVKFPLKTDVPIQQGPEDGLLQIDAGLNWKLFLSSKKFSNSSVSVVFFHSKTFELFCPPIRLPNDNPVFSAVSPAFVKDLGNAWELACRAMKTGRQDNEAVFMQVAEKVTILFHRVAPNVVAAFISNSTDKSPVHIKKNLIQMEGLLRFWGEPNLTKIDANDHALLRTLLCLQHCTCDFGLEGTAILPMAVDHREALIEKIRRVKVPSKLLGAIMLVAGQLAAFVIAKGARIQTADVNYIRLILMSSSDRSREMLFFPAYLSSGTVEIFVKSANYALIHFVLIGNRELCNYAAQLKSAADQILEDALTLQRFKLAMQEVPMLLPVRMARDYGLRHVVMGFRRPATSSAIKLGLRQIPEDFIRAAVSPKPGPQAEEWVKLLNNGKPITPSPRFKIPHDWLHKSKRFANVQLLQVHQFCVTDPSTGEESPAESEFVLDRLVPLYRKILELAQTKEKFNKVIEIAYETPEDILLCLYTPQTFIIAAVASWKGMPKLLMDELWSWLEEKEKHIRINVNFFT